MFRYVKEWEALTERIAFWVDMQNAYITYHNDYIESVWWMVRRLWDTSLLYQDYRSTPHCPRCGTSLSDAEVALGYKEDTPDPSVYVKFQARPTGALRDALPSEDDAGLPCSVDDDALDASREHRPRGRSKGGIRAC